MLVFPEKPTPDTKTKMEYNYYPIKEEPLEIKRLLISIDDLKIQMDHEKSLRKGRWIAIQEKLRVEAVL